MRFLTGKPSHDLTYDDVFMAPRRSSVTSRLDVDLTSSDGLNLPLPLIVANMTAVSGRRMAETVARRGGIAIIPQDLPTDIVATAIAKVKAAHTVFDTPLTIDPHATVGEALMLLPKRAHGLVVVVDAEGTPLGTVSVPNASVAAKGDDAQMAYKLKQGRLLCGLEMKLVDDAGHRLPHDGKTPGRLMIKGPTIARGYFGGEGGDVLDDEGFFDTGDVSTIDGEGYMQITDRAKDVVKSGGEWISSIEIENIATGHPAVAIAAVVGIAHPKWDERPILLCELKPGVHAGADDIRAYLDGKIARWWMPDDIVFVDAIPLGPTGKIDKKAIRAGLEGYELPFEVSR